MRVVVFDSESQKTTNDLDAIEAFIKERDIYTIRANEEPTAPTFYVDKHEKPAYKAKKDNRSGAARIKRNSAKNRNRKR